MHFFCHISVFKEENGGKDQFRWFDKNTRTKVYLSISLHPYSSHAPKNILNSKL